MAQIVLPDGDVNAGSWTSTPIWSKIDDDSTVNPTGDGTTVSSADNSNPDDCDLTLASASDPGVTTGHILRARWNKSASGGHTVNAVLELYQGATPGTGTLVATLSVAGISETETESTYTLSSGEAGNITDYASLSLRLSRQGDTGGQPATRRSLVVDLVELELPDADTSIHVTSTLETLSLSGLASIVSINRAVTSTLESLTLSAQASTVDINRNVTSGLATLSLSALASEVNAKTQVESGLATLTITALDSTVTAGSSSVDVTSTLETLSLTAQNSAVSINRNVVSSLGSLTLSALASSVTTDYDIQSGAAGLNLITYKSDVTTGNDPEYLACDWYPHYYAF